MRTLYTRIIVTTMLIMIISALLAFFASNIYYEQTLKPQNDEKVTQIAHEIAVILQKYNQDEIDEHLSAMANLGYKFYLVDEQGNKMNYGDPFSSTKIDQEKIDLVLAGESYHGIKEFPWGFFVTGFFSNNLENTIGIPIYSNEEVFALFVRPDTAKLFGEMRIFLAVLVVLTLLLSFLFVLGSTRYIVQPIRRLRDATKKIAAGNYHIKLRTKRKDEIGRLASDFTKMSTSLQQIEEQRQEFVSNVSHEIQSPLTSVQGFSQALREEELTTEERTRYLSIIEKESRRLSVLSDQLLTLSFLDSEQTSDDIVTFNVTDQLKEIIVATEWQRLEKEIAIELDMTPIDIMGDPKLLHQVWMNIVTNAIRYTPSGGMITIQAIEYKSYIEVIFKDTGIGIEEEHLSQLFDRFYKVDKARTRTQLSTGLGLSITKKIVEIHDGSIVVDSELGVGSTFRVTLPK